MRGLPLNVSQEVNNNGRRHYLLSMWGRLPPRWLGLPGLWCPTLALRQVHVPVKEKAIRIYSKGPRRDLVLRSLLFLSCNISRVVFMRLNPVKMAPACLRIRAISARSIIPLSGPNPVTSSDQGFPKSLNTCSANRRRVNGIVVRP